jgi:hypothetical protein
MSTDLARRTSDDICREINACSAKLAQAEKKVEDWKDTRRQFLQELKDRFPEIWLKEVKEKCNIGRAMAYRILQLPPSGKSSENNGSESTSRQAEYSSEEGAEQQEERPRDIAIRLSRQAPGTPEELAADALLLVESFLKQYQIDLQPTRAALIRMLTEAQNANVIEGDAAAEESPSVKRRGRPPGSKNEPNEAASEPAEESPGNSVDTDKSAEAMKAAHEAAEAQSTPAEESLAASVEPESAASTPEVDLTIPTFLRRDPPEQPVQP